MGGELGIKIRSVSLGDNSATPYGNFVFGGTIPNIDLKIVDTGRDFLYICGENDWGYLMADALLPICKVGDSTFREIEEALLKYDGNPAVIILGKNDFRTADILHRLRGNGDELKIYKGVPMLRGTFDNGIKLLGKQEKEYFDLPFN